MKIVDGHIAEYGRGVIATEGYCGSFSYTIGHAEKDLPELILTNLDPATAKYVLNLVGDMLFSGKEANKPIPEEMQLDRVKVRLCEAPYAETTHAFQATYREDNHGRPAPKILQVVWPDAAGLFPGEDGYNSAEFPQPLFTEQGEEWLSAYLNDPETN